MAAMPGAKLGLAARVSASGPAPRPARLDRGVGSRGVSAIDGEYSAAGADRGSEAETA